MRRKSAQQNELPDWKIHFLCTGEKPERAPEVNPFEALVFCSSVRCDPCCWGRSRPWWDLWPEVQDDPRIRAYRRTHGETWADANIGGVK